MKPLLACAFACLLLACGEDEATSHSEAVTINIKLKSSDTVNGVVTGDKNISTEVGNPYAAFIKETQSALGKSQPSKISVTETVLSLGGNSTGVTALGEVFEGRVNVSFILNDNTRLVASQELSAGQNAGPVKMPVSFDSTELPSADYDKLVAGDFKVHISGPAGESFTSKGSEADLQLQFRFAAYE